MTRWFLVAALLLVPARAGAHTTDVKQIIREIWPDHLEEAAIRVAWCESRHKPTAANRFGYRGLFQMGKKEWRRYGEGGDVFDPWDNAEGALRLYEDRRWQPWTCARMLGFSS